MLDGRVLRVVSKPAVESLSAFLHSPIARHFVDRGDLIDSKIAKEIDATSLFRQLGENGSGCDDSEAALVLEHPLTEFPSYPHEWPAEMLHAAAQLTLEIGEAFLGEGIGLKDADPRNILFRGPHPVFVDVLSFEKRDPGDPVWLPYAQFVRRFLLPLAVNRRLGVLHSLPALTGDDGLRPQTCIRC